MNKELTDLQYRFDALEWCRQNAKTEVIRVFTDRRPGSHSEALAAFSFTDAQNNSAILIVDGIRRFPMPVSSAVFIVSSVSEYDKPPVVFYLASWHQAEGWILLHRMERNRGPHKPWDRAYHLVIL